MVSNDIGLPGTGLVKLKLSVSTSEALVITGLTLGYAQPMRDCMTL